jgi:YbdK family carboxylate-amine ligase
MLALQQNINGCHVHVGIDDADLRAAVSDHCRPWLPVLPALTASSPFWEGTDTGYASYRSQWYSRWPIAGPPPVLGDDAGFRRRVEDLISVGVISDASFLLDVRPSARYPTLEFPVADVCPLIDDAVLHAGLVRSLARTMAGFGGAAAGMRAVPGRKGARDGFWFGDGGRHLGRRRGAWHGGAGLGDVRPGRCARFRSRSDHPRG